MVLLLLVHRVSRSNLSLMMREILSRDLMDVMNLFSEVEKTVRSVSMCCVLSNKSLSSNDDDDE